MNLYSFFYKSFFSLNSFGQGKNVNKEKVPSIVWIGIARFPRFRFLLLHNFPSFIPLIGK